MITAVRLILVLPLLLACNPEFDNRFSSVDSPRVLAVQSTPAEVAPGKAIAYRMLVVDEQGTVARPAVDWSFCTRSKPISELNDVAAECFGKGDFVQPFAMGATAEGTLPKSACRQFGPDIPETQPGEPPGRPTDPDSSGGFYQPLILSVHAKGETISTLAETRITCGLANGAGDIEAFRKRSKPNENPKLNQVVASDLGDAALSADAPLSVPHGQLVTLRASWSACPTEPSCGDGMCTSGETASDCPDDCTNPVGCAGPEEYAYVDPASSQLISRHESMRLSWFATKGEFRDDHTGRPEEEFAVLFSDNTWRAPATPGSVFMWVVLRDARGGVDWQSFQLQVE